ncbi:MAG: ABC transporter ATP-binding protein, partial [Armatimonadota bacterium]
VGDESFQQKCYLKVRELQSLGKTIIFVSHDLKAVREVATRAIWLDQGVIRADGDVTEVLNSYLNSVLGSSAPSCQPTKLGPNHDDQQY